MKLLKTVVIAVLLMLPTVSSSYGQDEGPTTQLQPTIDILFTILDDESLRGPGKTEERRNQIMTAISDRFDFREMSRRVLGKGWNDLSADEQDYFVSQVTKLLENVYIGRLESYDGRDVEFVAERIKGKRAQVTTLVPYDGATIPIHYIMQREQTEWMVYDINIEGVSLVRNYKEQFRTILQQQNYEGLIKIIEKKNKEFANAGAAG